MATYARRLWLATVLLGLNTALARDCYVMQRSGEKLKGTELAAESDGTLKLQMEQGGPVQTFKPGTYAYGFVPRPPEVEQLDKALEAGKADTVLQQAAAAFDKYKYLGWGDHVAYLECLVYVQRKQFDLAQKAIERGQRYKARHEDELVKGSILAMLGLKQMDQAKPLLEKMMKSEDEGAAAFSFNVRGSILAQEGKKKEAALEYLKTLLLFKPGTVKVERDEARRAVVALLKETGDPRAAEFEKTP